MPSLPLTSIAERLLPASLAALGKPLANVLGLSQAQSLYETLVTQSADCHLADRLVSQLRVRISVAESDLTRIPAHGATLVTSNHPFGILDGAVLLHLLKRIRSDVKVLANSVLSTIPELAADVIVVDPVGGKSARRHNLAGLRQAVHHLETGGMLLVFPAGEVSHLRWNNWHIEDPDWSPTVARLIQMAHRTAPNLRIVPIHVSGSNSKVFQAAGLVHPSLRTALLPRELLNKRDTAVEVRIGSPIPASQLNTLENDAARITYLRRRTYLLGSREAFKPLTRMPLRSGQTSALEPVAAPQPAPRLAAEVDRLDHTQKLVSSGDLHCYISRAEQIPSILAEIGRLRELAFRAAGEGTGKATDLDRFDRHYQHLFIWNAAKQEIAGAYRIAATMDVLREQGLEGLYTSTLFRYSADFLHRMGPALELGRSWIRLEYQRSFSPLLLLWKGIGKFVARDPRCKVLFGPVSISNRYQHVSQQLMVSFLEKHAWLEEWAGMVSNRNPFRRRAPEPEAAFWNACRGLDELDQVVSDIEPGEGVPVLLRQYLKLGGRLLGFNVDPEFSDALDGLIVVDLTRTEPKLLERYLGKSEAQAFIKRQV